MNPLGLVVWALLLLVLPACGGQATTSAPVTEDIYIGQGTTWVCEILLRTDDTCTLNLIDRQFNFLVGYSGKSCDRDGDCTLTHVGDGSRLEFTMRHEGPSTIKVSAPYLKRLTGDLEFTCNPSAERHKRGPTPTGGDFFWSSMR